MAVGNVRELENGQGMVWEYLGGRAKCKGVGRGPGNGLGVPRWP